MKQRTLMDRLIEYLDWVILPKLGLVRMCQYEQTVEFFQDWLKDIALNQPISKEEKDTILEGMLDTEKEKC